jgi:methionine-gamma-lyase
MPEIETLALHAGEAPDPQTGALRTPLHMAASFKLPGFGRKLFDALLLQGEQPPHAYSRWSNPTVGALEERLAALEGVDACDAVRPVAALATATGMAAVSALLLTLLRQGDHVIASEVCYAGSVELLGEYLPRLGIDVSLVDTSDAEQVRTALRPETCLVYAETPANPILRIADIAALAEIAHDAGALLAVDSTFAGPTIQQPLALGADYVVHSLTKYLNGHGDALGGVVVGPAAGIRRMR